MGKMVRFSTSVPREVARGLKREAREAKTSIAEVVRTVLSARHVELKAEAESRAAHERIMAGGQSVPDAGEE